MKIFEKDGHKIIWGEAIEALDTIEDNSIDLLFADPPYNIGKKLVDVPDRWQSDGSYLKWCYRWLNVCISKLTHHGTMYVMTSTQNMPYFDLFLREKLSILSRIVWYYDSSSVQARKYFGSLYEPILHCVKNEKHYTFNANDILVEARTGAVRKLIDYRKAVPTVYNSKKVPGNVWHIPRVRYRMDEYENHPTQKPIALLERIIKASSNEGDLVVDPFSGTFTTSYVAKQLKRKSVGIEINEEYVKIGLRRLEIATHLNGERLRRQPKIYEEPLSEKQTSLFEKKAKWNTNSRKRSSAS
ncbi:MAG: adenine-specific DNA-methyltransferase [Bacteroidetes bacterium]|nr:adenine-specific DNA-methyltransferase [Bacteroidota bacterium]MCL5737683.1 adenine-specific DNA-methyltransferase [Bacteroidota bacterium]